MTRDGRFRQQNKFVRLAVVSIDSDVTMGGKVCLLLGLVLSLQKASSTIKFTDSTLYEGASCQLKDGRDGICSSTCEGSGVKRDNSTICSFVRHAPIFCCPLTKSYPTLERLCSQQKETQEEKRRERQEMFERCKIMACTTPAPRVPSSQNENSHMAVLGWQTGNLTDWKCGGSLIHPSFILTAAHCVEPMGQPDIARVGGVNLEDDMYDYFVVDYDVITSHIHPQYRKLEYYNDIALLEVRKTLDHEFRTVTNLACLWLKREFPDEKLLAMGYGAPAFGQSFTYKLYQNNLEVIETDMCKKYYTAMDVLPMGLIDSIICAYDPDGLADTCEGDSGGPLLYKEKDWMKTPYVVAVISFGTVCLSGDPGAYTRVHSYLDWIEGVVSQHIAN